MKYNIEVGFCIFFIFFVRRFECTATLAVGSNAGVVHDMHVMGGSCI